MSKLSIPVTFALAAAALFSLFAPRAQAGGCDAEYHALELAVDTAEYICGGSDANMCAYAQQKALDAGRAYRDCEARDHDGPQT